MNAAERARVASNERWARPGARERQSAALRAANRRRAERAVDPDGVMSPDELDAAVANYYRARMARVRSGEKASTRYEPDGLNPPGVQLTLPDDDDDDEVAW